MTTIFRSEKATPTTFVSKSTAGINHVSDRGGGNLIAASKVDGVHLSSDLGLTWGSVIGTGQGGPWFAVYPTSTGRLIAVDNTSGAGSPGVYTSDDAGVTWTLRTTASATEVPVRGAIIVERPNGHIYMRQHDDTPGDGRRYWFSSDDGTTWATALVGIGSATSEGCAFIVRNSGVAEMYIGGGSLGTVVSGRRFSGSIGVDTAISGVASLPGGLFAFTTRAGYHSGDDEVGLAIARSSTEWEFWTVDGTDTFTQRFVSSASKGFTEIYWANAIPGIPQKWAVVTRDSIGLDELWLSTDSDHSTFTVSRTSTEGNPAQGVMTNLIPAG